MPCRAPELAVLHIAAVSHLLGVEKPLAFSALLHQSSFRSTYFPLILSTHAYNLSPLANHRIPSQIIASPGPEVGSPTH
eukprot:1160029-Pelagomonas_calceolata.AAC.1